MQLKYIATVVAALIPLAVSTSVGPKNCKSNEFWWGAKNCCLEKGGPPKPPTPPKDTNCPPTSYYWGEKQGCCVPRNPPPSNPPPPQCPKGWTWYPALSRCSKTPTPPVTPPSQPSNYNYNNGKSQHNGKGPGQFFGGHKRSVKSRASLCPSDLDACPISGLSGDYECLDTSSELESCGGCTSVGQGQDCTKITGAWNVGCERGSCVVLTCAGGFRIGADDILEAIFIDVDDSSPLKLSENVPHYSPLDLFQHLALVALLENRRVELRQFYTFSYVTQVSATPIPLPLPLMAADYTVNLLSVNRSSSSISPRRLQSLPMGLSVFSHDHGATSSKRNLDLDALTQSYDAANLNAEELRDLAASSAGVDEDDYDFQKQYVTGLTSFSDNMSIFQSALAEAASDKGLANYDRQNDVETLLKKVVNANKDVLSSTTTVVYNIPGIGPVLGPIVYDVKCLVDGLLDATEDLTDAIVNALGPSLRALLGQASEAVCKSGAEVAGLCV
ncbi:Protein priA [Psilocybe cubensis]|uniref:Protein CPL1-like domain-containing protein n=2 Tax=Psilocybe cubensis TaxID=181762 RepID=A0A8H7YAZ3_PSICU|nr:Protein priA [Psilocybe cubensis]KAH9486921.1 Protein priA [Psilocybe cubensis]